MNNSWKLSILGAVALAASTAVMAIGCTVTTTNGPLDDGGIGDDASTTDGGADTGTTDTGTGNDGGTCAATAVCPIIASTGGVSFDNPQCGACDTCSANNCCAEITKCFAQVDGGDSECSQLYDCFAACANPNDAGITQDQCNANCGAAYPNGLNDAIAADKCQSGDGDAGTGKCTTECQ